MLQGPLLSHQAVGPLTHLMAAVVLSQASLSAFHAMSHFIFIPAPKVRMIVIPISQMQKPRFRQAKYLPEVTLCLTSQELFLTSSYFIEKSLALPRIP